MFIDEFTPLLKSPKVVQYFANVYANAAKHGLQIILTARVLDGFSQRIGENLKTELIGKISSSQISEYVKNLQCSEEHISQCATFNNIFKQTSWLVNASVKATQQFSLCRYHAL